MENAPTRPIHGLTPRTWLVLGLFLLGSVVAAGAGSLVTPMADAAGWYDTLDRPAWSPPDWLFGPVWTVLYVAMAVAGWLVWRQDGLKGARLPLSLYAAQLVLNGLWTWLFFGLQKPWLAFVELAALWLLLCVVTVLFFQRRRLAGWLFVPYLAWVTFASALNLSLALRNA